MADALLIPSYYRSGTSALSGALQRLGVVLHNDAAANEHNPRGFYEVPELIELDVDLFTRLGVEWTDVRGLPDNWAQRADMASFTTRLEEILRRRFGGEKLWGLKHPHLCRLLPLYEKAARQAGNTVYAIHIFRDPWAVAASQARKNNLSRAHALVLWASYVTDAERLARHLPRAWLTYEDLMATPAPVLKRLERELGISLGTDDPDKLAAACGSLAGELNRSRTLPRAGLMKLVAKLVEEIWDAVRDGETGASTWDGFAARCGEVTAFLSEIAATGGTVVPGLGAAAGRVANAPAVLRPAERTDEGAKRRLAVREAAAPNLPRVAVLIAAPPRRAHAIGDCLAALEAQWRRPDMIKIFSADVAEIAGQAVVRVSGEAGALTRALCAALNAAAAEYDYVALLNAGDTVAPDACLRFALLGQQADADLMYCDEVVPADRGPWVRHKPGWDVTRLRQSPFLGDWVWYRGAAVLAAGGFETAFAGAEEYQMQLRLAEAGAKVARLPETLFFRAPLSRRDNIPATIFGQLAQHAVTAHLARTAIFGEAAPRAHLGLLQHKRALADPGTAIVLLCEHASLDEVNFWTQSLLTGPELTGPLVLAGAALTPGVASYLAQVAAAAELRGKILAVPPRPDMTQGEALKRALAAVESPHVAILEASALPATPDWLGALRARLADPAVAVVSGRSLVKLLHDPARYGVQGPIIRGADTRLGAGHLADDPGPGGWLAVDQEAGAVAPGGILLRGAALAGLQVGRLAGDALWIDVCAQIRAAGHKIVWTPDVSFVVKPESIRPDFLCTYRGGSKAARALPGAEELHHPALSLRGDLLAPEQRLGLVRAAPADAQDLLITGAAAPGMAVLNAARALRMAGRLEAGWAPEPLLAAEYFRREPSVWVRINPDTKAAAGVFKAVLTRPAKPEQAGALLQAAHIFATSPALVKQAKAVAPGRPVSLWRPALSRPVWAEFAAVGGLNTNPRVLWIDEGIAPDWLAALIRETSDTLAWIVVERADQIYAGEMSRLKMPPYEQAWARELAALSPQILVRPAQEGFADHYAALLAAAAGCHLLVDERLDLPETMPAWRLDNDPAIWRARLAAAAQAVAESLALGAAARLAALALPDVDAAPPAWASAGKTVSRRAAA